MKSRDRQAWGKVSPDILERVVYRNLGAPTSRIIVGPKRGFDNAVLSLGGGRVMILTTDPISAIPQIGMKTSAWLSVHLIASDYCTSGLGPEFASFDFNFPGEMSARDKRVYLRGVGDACRDLGVSIVAGHTGSYPGGGFTVIGGGTMLGFGMKGTYVDPSMSHVGDSVVITKGVAIEAVATLANSFPKATEIAVGEKLASQARKLICSCSVVKDARAASRVGLGEGAVTSMHDATEGGVLGGLEEMAAASGHSMVVEEGEIPISQEVSAVCSAFEIDPLTSLSEGTLLVTAASRRCEDLLQEFEREGIMARRIGEVRQGRGLWLRKRGKTRRFRPVSDSYWIAYARGEPSVRHKTIDVRSNRGGL